MLRVRECKLKKTTLSKVNEMDSDMSLKYTKTHILFYQRQYNKSLVLKRKNPRHFTISNYQYDI